MAFKYSILTGIFFLIAPVITLLADDLISVQRMGSDHFVRLERSESATQVSLNIAPPNITPPLDPAKYKTVQAPGTSINWTVTVANKPLEKGVVVWTQRENVTDEEKKARAGNLLAVFEVRVNDDSVYVLYSWGTTIILDVIGLTAEGQPHKRWSQKIENLSYIDGAPRILFQRDEVYCAINSKEIFKITQDSATKIK